MRGCIFQVVPETSKGVINNMFICHFADPDLEVEIFFEKEEAAK